MIDRRTRRHQTSAADRYRLDRPQRHAPALGLLPALRRVAHLRDADRPRRPALVLGAARPSKPGSMRISNQVATMDEVKAEFEASWKQWKEWAGMEEVTSAEADDQ